MKPVLFSNGIEVCETSDGHRAVFIRYQHGKRQHRDRVAVVPAGSSLARRQGKAVSEARNKLDGVRAEIKLARLNRQEWLHPKEAARRQAEQDASKQAEEQTEREGLLYETVIEDFLRDEAFDDASPTETANALRNRCSKAFAGRSWADLTQQDRTQYALDRINATACFDGCPSVGPRTPQSELSTLRRVGNYLRRRGLMDANPFAVPVEERNTRSRKKARRNALTYEPKRKPVIASDEAILRMFELCEAGWDEKKGRKVEPDLELAAMIALCAYTGPRPESEPCRLRRRDVELPEPGKIHGIDGSPVLGSVTYANPKGGTPRTVPLHPHAASFLGPLIDDLPEDDPEIALFRKRGSKDPWDRNSYRDRWTRLRSRVAKDYPEVEGMWLRDFRKLFKTRLLDAGANPVAIKVLQGHSLSVDEGYYELTAEHAATVVLMLDWQLGREVGREVGQAEEQREAVSR